MHIRNAMIATAALGLVALAASAADAQYAPYGYSGPYASPLRGRYHSYGADHANPSFAPHSYDQDNPRDFQLQGHN